MLSLRGATPRAASPGISPQLNAITKSQTASKQ
jgi:hypothetical protein